MDQESEKQKLLLSYVASNEIIYAKVKKILHKDYFSSPYDRLVEFLHEYHDNYKSLPTVDIIKVESGIDIPEKIEITKEQFDYIVDETESYCKNVAFRQAILKSAEEIMQNKFGGVEKRVREALSLSVDTDLGLNIFENVKQRILTSEEDIDPIALGWYWYDFYTEMTRRGELTLLAGESGSGKSVFLTNIARLISNLGLNVIYFSLELKATMVAKRFDSIITGVPIKEVGDNPDKIESLYNSVKDHYGDLYVKKVPVGANANDIRALLFEYELQKKRPVDVIIIDHLDLMTPNAETMKGAGVFDRDKEITEEVREIIIDYNAYGFTASQLNRDSIDVKNKSKAHIAGGMSKINTSDVAVAISKTDEQIDAGLVELQFLKLRNASMKVKPVLLKWCEKTLRISDPEENELIQTQMKSQKATKPIATDQKQSLSEMLAKLNKGRN